MEDTLDTTYEISKLIKKSPKREVIFGKIKGEMNAGSPGSLNEIQLLIMA